MMMDYRRNVLLAAALLTALWPEVGRTFELPERRRDPFAGDFSYYIYPIAGEIPGLGTAAGVGGSVLNSFGTDTDFTWFEIGGDFSASGYTLLNVPLVERRLILDLGTYDFDVSQASYSRGMDSSPDHYLLPRATGSYLLGQLTLSFDDRRYEAYVRALGGASRLREVSDENGEPFGAVDTREHTHSIQTIGASIDLTDDRLDPRRGFRLEVAARQAENNDALRSDYYVTDLNLTGYVPMRHRRDTLVINYFQSDAHVTREGETDYAILEEKRGLGCDAVADPAQQDRCLELESEYLNEFLAANLYGTATPLGGTQRLRSFDNGRYYAGHAASYGIEYRWNLTDENTPFNILIAKGVRTGIQLAAFAERGSVAETSSTLWDTHRTSYGAGLRIILTGVVIRADWAKGDEGENFQFFITYPWSMFSVDSPG